ARCSWEFALPEPVIGETVVTVETGEQARIPLSFDLPRAMPEGEYALSVSVAFSGGKTQTDSFTIHVVSPLDPIIWGEKRLALFDPVGETRTLLTELNTPFDAIDANADLSAYDTLIIGKKALTLDGAAPDIARVREGLNILVFEQTSDVLERRLGFRVQEYGLRQVFPRAADHAALKGVGVDQLRDWRGEATTTEPVLTYRMRPQHGPTVDWAGIETSRPWRRGNRGNVASVLIEKPGRGDFLPIVDGGFALQYTPLVEYREGSGAIVFCQLDVTGRTQPDPAAIRIVTNLVRYVATRQPSPSRAIAVIGDRTMRDQLATLGVDIASFAHEQLADYQALVVGPGSASILSEKREVIGEWIDKGGYLLTIGLHETELSALPVVPETDRREYIASTVEPDAMDRLLEGVGSGDLHIRVPRELSLIGGNALAQSIQRNVVFCQIAPWMFGGTVRENERMPYRRTSFVLARLLGNMGVRGETPLVGRVSSPPPSEESRWLDGLYVDQPIEMDDPYRFFRW
ncbi:MAG: hypothetical protein O3A46_15445, partial [Candidatus Poribacteria bacterium]|nr:hypothetical protein [Candidatus Poribacteria bacterium]